MPRNEGSQSQAAADVEMPPDGTEQRDDSPHAAEPVRRAPRKPAARKAATTRVREYDVPTKDLDQSEQDHDQDDREPEFVDESPLSALSESTLAMCHVSRVGPGTGAGWVGGMFFDYGDGRGPQPVSKGPVGTFQKTKDLFDVVVSEAGGGRFRFVTKGQPPYEETFPNPPLPLPMERQGQGQGPFQGGFPNGAVPNGRGGFDRGSLGGFDPREMDYGPRDPFDSPEFDPEVGVAAEDFAKSTLNGWHQNGQTGLWVYYVNGVATRPPRGSRPPRFGIGAPAFDYSSRGDDDDDRVARLEKQLADALSKKDEDRLGRIERLLAEKQSGGALDSMVTMMMKSMEDSQKARDHEFKMAQLKQGADEKERASRAAAEAAALVESRKIDLQIAQAKADADKAIAAANAAVLQANATAAMNNAEKIATITASSNDKVFAAMSALHKPNDVSMFKEGLELAQGFMQGKESSPAEEIAAAIDKAAPSISKAASDVVATYRGGTPQHTLAPGQPQGAAPPPQLPAPAQGSPDERREIAANFQLLGYLCDHVTIPIAPSVPVLRSGVIAYGLKHRFTEIQNKILMATPALIVSEAERAVTSLGSPPDFVHQLNMIKAIAATPAAAAWLEGLKAAIRKPPAAAKPTGAAPSAPAPQAAAPAAPVPPANPTVNSPGYVAARDGCDPTRPEIPNRDAPVPDPRAVDPARPPIYPS